MIDYWKVLKIGIVITMFFLSIACQQQPQQQAEVSNSQDYKLHYTRGLSLGIDGKFSLAQAELENSLQIQPLYTPAEGCLRIAKDAQNGVIEADAAKALFRGIELGNRSRTAQKLREINVAISLSPAYAPAYNERGIAYFDLGKYRQALSDRNKAIELEPDYAASYYNKAVVCEELSLFDEAINAYQEFLERAPESYGVHIQFARIRIAELEMMLENQHSS